jgi:glycosyltransferase involved in cell wall biosynthesis
VTVGVVVIGRNEGQRLARCLASVQPLNCPVVYVDSDSCDGSAALARSLGVQTLELDRTRPMSAARARNEGFDALLHAFPALRFVQFLDGDCTLLPHWMESAERALCEDARRAAVFGGLLERDPGATLYNRLCASEWRCSTGDLSDHGALVGIFMVRADVFRELHGFRPEVIAGEEPELGVRMGLAGYRIARIDRPMAIHDAGLQRFGQWWRRAVRAGHAIGQRSHLHGSSRLRDCVRERASTVFWGIALPLAIVSTVVPTRGASALLLAAYAVQAVRIWRFRRSLGEQPRDAVLYATFVLIAKFANAIGLLAFHLNRAQGRYQIIEYK